MKLKFDIIEATATQDGDIFYCNPNPEINDFGPHALLSGTDQIFIRDDVYDVYDEGNISIAVNGGNVIHFLPGEKVVRLGHYSELIRIVEMIQYGNPDMEIGANDFHTIKDKLGIPDVDLLKNLNLKFNFDCIEEGNIEEDDIVGNDIDDDDEIPDIKWTDDQLPF